MNKHAYVTATSVLAEKGWSMVTAKLCLIYSQWGGPVLTSKLCLLKGSGSMLKAKLCLLQGVAYPDWHVD
jgi:hypothetical protein